MSFVSEFVAYLQQRTDCPRDFHVHAALCCLATALGNQCYCDGWSRDIYPNLWTIIIAPSGFGKSAPLDMADSLLNQAGLGDRVLPNTFSQEAVISTVAKRPVGLWINQEFAAFMATLGREYNAGCEQWLTELYDVPRRTQRLLRQETITIELPTISILAASSPDWFAQSFKSSQLRGGFLARFVFCPSTDHGEYVEDPGPRDDRAEIGLAGHLRDVADLSGKFSFTGVHDMFTSWDKEQRLRLRDDCPPEFQGLRARSGALAKKAAMLFHVSRTTADLVISEEDLRLGFTYVEKNQRLAEKYLSEGVAHGRDDSEAMLVLEKLHGQGDHAPKSIILRNSHLSSSALARAERTLVESGRLIVRREPDSKAVWYCTPEWENNVRNLVANVRK